jgi:hypothetical protein
MRPACLPEKESSVLFEWDNTRNPETVQALLNRGKIAILGNLCFLNAQPIDLVPDFKTIGT